MKRASCLIIFVLTLMLVCFIFNFNCVTQENEGKIYFERGCDYREQPPPSSPPGSDIWSINPDGTGETRLTNIGKFYFPVLSPDGKYFVYMSQPEFQEYSAKGKLAISPVDGSKPKCNSEYDYYYHRSTPQWFSDSTLFRNLKDIFNLNLEKVDEIPVDYISNFAYTGHSPDGSQIIYTEGAARGGLLVFIVDEGKERIFTKDTFCDHAHIKKLSWSPDGKYMALCWGNNYSYEIWKFDTGDNEIFSGDGEETLWTPDSRSIIYHIYDYDYKNSKTNSTEVYIIKSDGTDKKKLLSKTGKVTFKYCSPDGSEVLCLYGEDYDPEMWIYEMDTGKFYKIADNAYPLGWVK